MSGTTVDRRDARQALEADLLAELRRVGPERLQRRPIVERHAASTGLPPSTLYRWAAEFIDSGRAGRRLAAEITAAAEARAASTPEPARAAAVEAVATLPVAPSPDAVMRAAAGTGLPFLKQLQKLIAVAEEIETASRAPDGKPRNPKAILQSVSVRLRGLEVGLRAQQALAELAEVDRFHALVIEEISKEAPDVAERIVRRVSALTATFEDA